MNARDGAECCLRSGQLTTDQRIAIRTSEHTEPTAELVDAVAAQLALVMIVELLATAAAFAGCRDTRFECCELAGDSRSATCSRACETAR